MLVLSSISKNKNVSRVFSLQILDLETFRCGTSTTAKCCQRSTDDRRFLSFSASNLVYHAIGVMQHVARVTLRQLRLVFHHQF